MGLQGIGERPGLPPVGPVLGRQAVRLAEPRHSVGALAGAMQMLPELEAGGGAGMLHVARL